jgi:hypothetical protein
MTVRAISGSAAISGVSRLSLSHHGAWWLVVVRRNVCRLLAVLNGMVMIVYGALQHRKGSA